jgi:hypothetical protein
MEPVEPKRAMRFLGIDDMGKLTKR